MPFARQKANDSASLGTGFAAVLRPEPAPGVERAISSAVASATAPAPCVVRSSVRSWITTGTRRASAAQSISMARNPIAWLRRMAASVFSGASPAGAAVGWMRGHGQGR